LIDSGKIEGMKCSLCYPLYSGWTGVIAGFHFSIDICGDFDVISCSEFAQPFWIGSDFECYFVISISIREEAAMSMPISKRFHNLRHCKERFGYSKKNIRIIILTCIILLVCHMAMDTGAARGQQVFLTNHFSIMHYDSMVRFLAIFIFNGSMTMPDVDRHVTSTVMDRVGRSKPLLAYTK